MNKLWSGRGQFKTVPMPERFWEKVDKRGPNECWEWIANKYKQGYGMFKLKGKQIKSHRMTWRLVYGSIPENMCVLHKCDNTSCCNPAHLFLGTYLDNNRDRAKKGRSNHPTGESNKAAKLKLTDVEEIRKMYATGEFRFEDLSRKFGVCASEIGNIVHHRVWR